METNLETMSEANWRAASPDTQAAWPDITEDERMMWRHRTFESMRHRLRSQAQTCEEMLHCAALLLRDDDGIQERLARVAHRDHSAGSYDWVSTKMGLLSMILGPDRPVSLTEPGSVTASAYKRHVRYVEYQHALRQAIQNNDDAEVARLNAAYTG